MEMATRLDPLKFPDETKAGLALVAAYILFDITQTAMFGGWFVANAFGEENNKVLAGAAQLVMLLALTMALVWRRHIKVARALRLQPLEVVDEAFARDAARVGEQIAPGRCNFMVTGNLADANAFCLAAGRKSRIVLGGGLRLLFRKDPQRARAIVAHECAHIASGDVSYVVFGWLLFVSYATLATANCVLAQLVFWYRVANLWPSYSANGYGFVDIVRLNVPFGFAYGFGGLLPVVGVWLLQRHFFRLREFRADERSAQCGYRAALSATLRSAAESTRKRATWRLLSMHPSVDERVRFLESMPPWGRQDAAFLTGMAFIVARIGEDMPSPGDGGTIQTAPTPQAMVEIILNSTPSSFWLTLALITLQLALVFVMSLHVYRTSAVTAHLGGRVAYRLSYVFSSIVAVLVGGFLGSVTCANYAAAVADPRDAFTLIQAIDASLVSSALSMFLFWYLAVSIVAFASRDVIRAPKGPAAQTVRLAVRTAFVALGLEVVVSFGSSAVWYLTGGMAPWVLTSLPSFTTPMLRGVPSLLQASAILLVVAAALAVLRWLGVVRLKTPRGPTHAGWHASA